MNLGSFAFWYLVIFVLVVWMAVRVGRSSSTMGVVTFLFWPVAVVPLFTNWGNRDSDIRLPFVLTTIASLMLIYNTNKAMYELAMGLDADDIAYIRETDPETAAMIERRQAAMGYTVASDDEAAVSSGRIVATAVSTAPQASAGARSGSATAAADMQFAAAPATVRHVPLHELRFRRGTVRLASAFSTLQIPEHFRFISSQQLGTLAEIRGVAVEAQSLGWVVHERVDLRSRDFWFVDIQFHESGHLAPPAGSSDLMQVPADLDHMSWDATLNAATWTHADAETTDQRHDRYVARLLRHGAVLMRMRGLSPDQRELGLRTTRMLVQRVHTDAGWEHAEFIGDASVQTLSNWAREQTGFSPDTAEAEAVEFEEGRG